MNVDKLEAGRELDALIAEKVMGYECVCDEEPVDCPIHNKADLYTLRPYSTDIAAAWGVVEKLRLFVMPWGLDEWCAANQRDERLAFSDILESGETAPLAICRAALKAKKCRIKIPRMPWIKRATV